MTAANYKLNSSNLFDIHKEFVDGKVKTRAKFAVLDYS